MMNLLRLLTAAAFASLVVPAHADISVTAGSGTVIFDFTCFTTKHCPAAVPIDSAGAALTGAAGSPSASALTIQGIAGGQVVPISGTVTATGPLTDTQLRAVAVPISGSLSTVTSLSQFGGQAITLGAGAVASGTLRITQASDSPEIAALGAPSATAWVSGDGTIISLLKAGVVAAQSGIPPQAGTIVVGGFNVAAINNVTPLMGTGNTGTGSLRTTTATDQVALAAWGHGATAATAPAGATQDGCRAASSAPTEVTNGQLVGIQCGLGGKIVFTPFTIKELALRGGTTSTDTSAHEILPAGTGSNKSYLTDWECSNTSATSVLITLSDSIATKFVIPAGGGNNKSIHVPLVSTAAATNITFTSSSGVSTVYCYGQGYAGL